MLGVSWIVGLAGNVHISITYIFDILISWQVTEKLHNLVYFKDTKWLVSDSPNQLLIKDITLLSVTYLFG